MKINKQQKANHEEITIYIHDYCKKKNINLATLSRMLGYNEVYISHIMMKNRTPSIELWNDLKERIEDL